MVSAVSKLPIEFVVDRIFTFDLLVYLYTSKSTSLLVHFFFFKNRETNMIQPWFIQFCIISVSTLINKWFKFNYICNTKRWNFLQIFIKSQIIHDFVWMYMWKFLCWFYIQNAFERLNYKITKRNIHFRLLLIFFKFQFKI